MTRQRGSQSLLLHYYQPHCALGEGCSFVESVSEGNVVDIDAAQGTKDQSLASRNQPLLLLSSLMRNKVLFHLHDYHPHLEEGMRKYHRGPDPRTSPYPHLCPCPPVPRTQIRVRQSGAGQRVVDVHVAAHVNLGGGVHRGDDGNASPDRDYSSP